MEMYFVMDSRLVEFYNTANSLVESSMTLLAGQASDVDRKACDMTLAAIVHHHMFPPMAMGSRAADIVHKLITVLSMMSRDVGAWQQIEKLVLSVIAWCTDFGTESLLGPVWHTLVQLPAEQLEEIFPGGTQFKYFDESENYEAEAVTDSSNLGVGIRDSLQAMCNNNATFQVAGGLHIVNNISKAMDTHIPWFEEWCKRANTISSFLRQRWTKELFLATCMKSAVGSHWKRKVEAFNATLVEWRFGESIRVAKDLLELHPCLKQFWNEKLLNSKNSEQAQSQATLRHSASTSDVAAATGVVHDALFWAYSKALLKLLSVLSHVSNWMETCPCQSSFAIIQ